MKKATIFKFISCTNEIMNDLIGKECILIRRNNDHLYGRLLWDNRDFTTSTILSKTDIDNIITIKTRNSTYVFQRIGSLNIKPI